MEGEVGDVVAVLEERGVDRWLAKGWELRALLPYMRGESPEAEEALHRVVEHSRQAGDLRQEGRALSLLLGTAVFGPLRVPEGIRRCEDILDRHAASPRITASATRALASLKSMRGDFEEARALVARDKALSEELGLPLAAARASFAYGSLELLADDPAAAEAELRAGYEVLAEIGDKSALCNVAAVLAQALYLQGDDAEALRFAGVAKRAAAESDRWAQVYWRGAQAKVLAKQGRFDEADELAHDAIAFAFNTDSLNTRGDALMDSAEVFRLADRDGEAAARARKAIHAYDRKGNRAAARKARRFLAEPAEVLV
jgi:tetratricopeptide (TPR) repeat protein